ncbi:preprotein translocase subunit SecE [Nocardia jiangxiensis]|uniref:Protein translocase subunit SecE n=1 Tax=Nocardia jiangxiensis TaxID=282685 RepID=A0ABW6RUT4_9NOCA|nr:preprotein translocase subunit SecE [Nocardia jiangxiensis]
MSDDDDTRAVSRPTGKRSSRRARSGFSDHETGSVATIERDDAGSRKTSKPSGKKKAGGTGNPLKRLVKFLKEVVQELRKVIWPNRKQMVTYTTVVLVFVIFTVGFIFLLDIAFNQGVNWLFG